MSYCYDAEYCIMCGKIIPEGKQVCADCSDEVEKLYAKKSSRSNKKKSENGVKIAVNHIGLKRKVLVVLAVCMLLSGCSVTIENINKTPEETPTVLERAVTESAESISTTIEEQEIIEEPKAIEENVEVPDEEITEETEVIEEIIEVQNTAENPVFVDEKPVFEEEPPEQEVPEYNFNWARYLELNEPVVRFIKAAIPEEGNDGEKYLRWLYENDYEDHADTENWGPAFIAWAGETGYEFVTSGLLPKTTNAQAFYEYMTKVSWCRSFVFRSASPFAHATAVHCGDLVYPVENGICVDVGLITDVTEDAVTVIYGGGKGVHYVTYTAEDFVDEDSIMWDSWLQHIEYKRNSRICLDYLLNECNLNWASALGIMANLSVESDFSPVWAGDDYTSFGICQWNGPRWINLENFCIERGYDMTCLQAQLEFLKYELEGPEEELYEYLLKKIPNTRNGCALAAKTFCIKFENPQDADIRAAERSENAKAAFWDHYSPIKEEGE